MSEPLEDLAGKARASLWRWAAFSEKYWWSCPDRLGQGCFGTGTNGWGVQTNQKYLAAMAVLGTEPDEPADGIFSREQALGRALAALRYSLATHCTGDQQRADGSQWGRTWISGLGVERMMHGVDRLDPHLTDADRAGLKRVLTDEADWLCTGYVRHGMQGVSAGRWVKDGGNHPESNIWNGAICVRAALFHPDHPHVAQWLERGHLFLLNGISVTSDADDNTVYAGRPLSEWHVGANFFKNYALDHHGYLNVGYMAICLSNIAMLHYAFVHRNEQPPESLYLHARDLWGLVRRLMFSDGRLLRLGGDTRIRYCYCQDYMIPALIFAADHWQDAHAADLLRGAVEQAVREQRYSDDGRFLCHRLGEMVDRAPHYYCRLESDKAVVLSQAVDWLTRRRLSPALAAESYEASVAGNWEEPEHGAIFHRCATRFAGWSWRASENPQGTCLPPDNGDLAEWQENLSGRVHGLGPDAGRELHAHTQASFPGGFLTVGGFSDRTRPIITEGWHDETTAFHQIAFAALPDEHTVVRLEYAVLEPRRVYLGGWCGVKLEIPNDVFNDCRRTYRSAQGTVTLTGGLGERRVTDLASRWANIEGAIGLVGIYGAESWQIVQRGHRIGGHAIGNILTDTFCWQLDLEFCDMYGPVPVLDNGSAILSSVSAEATEELSADGVRRVVCEGGDDTDACRAVEVRGQDGKKYVLVANFGAVATTVKVTGPAGQWHDLVADEPVDLDSCLSIPAGQGRVICRG